MSALKIFKSFALRTSATTSSNSCGLSSSCIVWSAPSTWPTTYSRLIKKPIAKRKSFKPRSS